FLADDDKLSQSRFILPPQAIEVSLQTFTHGLDHLTHGLSREGSKALGTIDLMTFQQLLKLVRQGCAIDFSQPDHAGIEVVMGMVVVCTHCMMTVMMVIDMIDALLACRTDAH